MMRSDWLKSSLSDVGYGGPVALGLLSAAVTVTSLIVWATDSRMSTFRLVFPTLKEHQGAITEQATDDDHINLNPTLWVWIFSLVSTILYLVESYSTASYKKDTKTLPVTNPWRWVNDSIYIPLLMSITYAFITMPVNLLGEADYTVDGLQLLAIFGATHLAISTSAFLEYLTAKDTSFYKMASVINLWTTVVTLSPVLVSMFLSIRYLNNYTPSPLVLSALILIMITFGFQMGAMRWYYSILNNVPDWAMLSGGPDLFKRFRLSTNGVTGLTKSAAALCLALAFRMSYNWTKK